LDTPKDCHGDGDVDVDGDGIPDDNDVVVVQRIYQDGNGNGTFERGSDTNFSPSVVGCRYFHPAHNHYHVEGFAELALRSDSTGQIVRTGDKISFCVADSGIFDGGLPGTPQRAFYSETGCTERLSIQGTSVGWYDLYAWGLPGQQLDVTGIPAGNYCLIVEGDPQNLLQESNEANNNRFFHVFVDPAQAPRDAYKTLKPLRTPCPA
jgi:hypothetical protein